MNSKEIRTKFFDYFTKHNHEKVTSSSLIPAQDPTLLFANAGMNQFKDLFLGNETRSYKRAVSIQKCVRAGGKHNDLDNVGFTKRHLTFFEMMGNFSFGDYFKKEAIVFAWEFLTKELNLNEQSLYASVFETDDESFDLWHKIIGLPKEKIYRLGAEENFWQMGDLGPCGPCSEIFYDRGPEHGCKEITNCGPACECDRFLEVWNLVFIQYDRQQNGELKPLSQTGVDTGMGLERLCAIMQDKDSVFSIDLFAPIIAKTEELSKLRYEQQDTKTKAAFHVLADHIRCASFLIADGCAPSNDGRGYVLRKIIRRAALFGQKLTEKQNLFPELFLVFSESIGNIYPALTKNKELIYQILSSEIEKFSANLIRGKQVLEKYLNDAEISKTISGNQAFTLYDRYGFPLELVIAAAREKQYNVDQNSFDELMQQQQAQSGKKLSDPLDHLNLTLSTEFTGYDELETISHVTALVIDNQVTESASKGTQAYIIAHRSPFFIVGGGQVPDAGFLVFNNHKVPLQEVRYINNAVASKVTLPCDVSVGDAVTQIVDKNWRIRAMKNHTGTHLLQSALIKLFGSHIKQAGSLVHPDYLRFDFTYHKNLTDKDIASVEKLVNEKITNNIPVTIEYTTLQDALKKGALAFFGDKYKPENVRIVQVADFSTELCGGTHVHSTGDIGAFKITEVVSPSAGQKRIFAVTGPRAIELFQETFSTVKTLGQTFKVKRDQVLEVVNKQKNQLQTVLRECKQLRKQLLRSYIPIWQNEIEEINGIPFCYIKVDDFNVQDLRDIAQELETKKPGFYFLISSLNGKIAFYTILSKPFATQLSFDDLQKLLQEQFAMRSGIRKNTMQGGGQVYDSRLKDSLKNFIKGDNK